MELIFLLFTLVLARIFAHAIPGPDFFVVTKNSLTHDRRAGVFTALGIGVSNLFHMSLCVFGLGIILSQSVLLFNVVKFVAALYLFYLGIKCWRDSEKGAFSVEKKSHNFLSNWAAFRSGLLVNLLNPKPVFFFLSIFSLVISPDMNLGVVVLACILMFLTTISFFSFLSFCFSRKSVQLFFQKFEKIFMRLFGGILIGLGGKMIFWEPVK